VHILIKLVVTICGDYTCRFSSILIEFDNRIRINRNLIIL